MKRSKWDQKKKKKFTIMDSATLKSQVRLNAFFDSCLGHVSSQQQKLGQLSLEKRLGPIKSLLSKCNLACSNNTD